MNPQIERLQALVAQLIARLEHERSESRRLASQLASLFSASRSGDPRL